MGIVSRVRDLMGGASKAHSVPAQPKAAFFQNGRNPLMMGWRPMLRESQADVQASWQEAASRAVEGVQNSGFLTKVVEVETGSVVGSGLRFSSRPDAEALGWTPEEASTFARALERGFRAYGKNPLEFDAAGKMTFGKSQQAAFASYKTFGEILALTPIIDREGSTWKSKVALIPPHRLSQMSDQMENIIQGVKVDDWGYPLAYKVKRWDKLMGWQDTMVQARDRDGRPNVVHVFDASISTTRGISPMAPVLKVVRQIDQYADATLTAALIQTIFAATIKSNISGVGAFDGLMTGGDTGALDFAKYLDATTSWYDAAKIDITQHGRIAHLFPNEELEFKQAQHPAQQYDSFMGWLMREVAAGAGVTYESATGDYRGATYSSIRMAGAESWLTVLRRRENVIIPYCEQVKDIWLDEAIFTRRLKLPKGWTYLNYLANREAIARGTWSGPAQPQADDYKAAKSHQTLKDIGGTTMKDIAESYGRDWEDDAIQKAEENRFYQSLDLPLPWSPTTMLETKEGQDKELEDPPEPTQPVKPAAKADDDQQAELDAETEPALEDEDGN